MSTVAYSSAVLFMPALWHSITVEVRMGTMWRLKALIWRATRTSMSAALAWSLMAISDLTST
jgi:hypothetical protein